MLIALSQDWHARGKDLAVFSAQANSLVDECLLRRVSVLGLGGDIFDKSTIGDMHASTGAIARAVIQPLVRLTSRGVIVVIVAGDHDRSGAGSEDALHVLDLRPGIRVFHEPGIWAEHEEIVFACVPWDWRGEDPEAVFTTTIEQAQNAADGRKVLLIAHASIDGMRLSKFLASEPSESSAQTRRWRLSRQFVEGLDVDWACFGDYHLRQTIAENRWYGGALRQLHRGEEGNPTGFDILDTQTGKVEFVELNAAPKYRKLRRHNSADVGDAVAMAGNNEYVSIEYDGPADPAEVARLEAAGVLVEQIVERRERIQRVELPTGVVGDPKALIRLWASAQTPPVEGDVVERMIAEHEELHADKPAEQPVEAEPVAVAETNANEDESPF